MYVGNCLRVICLHLQVVMWDVHPLDCNHNIEYLVLFIDKSTFVVWLSTTGCSFNIVI